MTVIQAYAPTSAAVDEKIDTFYEQLQLIRHRISRHDIITIAENFNAKVIKLLLLHQVPERQQHLLTCHW